jgi:hypothetical protein
LKQTLFFFDISNSTVDPIDEPIPAKTTHRGWTDGVDDARPPGNVSLTIEKDFIMNSKFIASALIAAAGFTSAGAFAAGADGSVDVQPTLTSSVTRAEVRAQAVNARPAAVTASNLVDGGSLIVAAPTAGDRSRADVRAEAVQAGQRIGSAPGRA